MIPAENLVSVAGGTPTRIAVEASGWISTCMYVCMYVCMVVTYNTRVREPVALPVAGWVVLPQGEAE